MSQTVRVIIVNTDEKVGADLRSVLLSLEGVKIVAEIDEPALLPKAIEQFPAEVLLIHLDPNPGAMMDVVAPLLESFKGRFAAIGMTEDRDAELVMRAMRSGMKEFLWKPFPPEQLGEILRRVSLETPGGGRNLGRLVTVVGAGGGVGATQLATNLSVELAHLACEDEQPRLRVAVVDLDLRFGQVAVQLDAQPTYTIAELCETPEQIDAQMIERAVHKHSTGVHILARPNEFAQAEQISAGQTAGALAALQEHYDFVVVDLPARFDPTARAVFDMADTFLLVLQLMVPYVRTADRMLHQFASSGYASERLRLVCNRFAREAGYLERSDVETTLKRSIDFTIPDDWKTSATAVNMGAPLFTDAPKSKLRLAYRTVAEALIKHDQASDEKPNETANDTKKGIFGFFAGAKAS